MCDFVCHDSIKYTFVKITSMSLKIGSAIILINSFCILEWVYFQPFFFNYSVILLSVFEKLNSSWSKLPSFSLSLKGSPCRYKKRTFSRIFKRNLWFSNFSWLKVSLNISPIFSYLSRITDIVDASRWQYELSCFLHFPRILPIWRTSWKKSILLFGW